MSHLGQARHLARTPPDRSGAPKSIPPAEYGAGLELAISRDWLELHESGTFVKLTQSGVDLFA